MRHKIRQSVFETNSSSTHCFVVTDGSRNLLDLEKEYIDSLTELLMNDGEDWAEYVSSETSLERIHFPTYDEYLHLCDYIGSIYHKWNAWCQKQVDTEAIKNPPSREIYEQVFDKYLGKEFICATTSNWVDDDYADCISRFEGCSPSDNLWDLDGEMYNDCNNVLSTFGFNVYELWENNGAKINEIYGKEKNNLTK